MSFKPRRSVTSEGHLVKAFLSNLSSESTPLFMGAIPESWAISVLAEGGNLPQGKTGGVGGLQLSEVTFTLSLISCALMSPISQMSCMMFLAI